MAESDPNNLRIEDIPELNHFRKATKIQGVIYQAILEARNKGATSNDPASLMAYIYKRLAKNNLLNWNYLTDEEATVFLQQQDGVAPAYEPGTRG